MARFSSYCFFLKIWFLRLFYKFILRIWLSFLMFYFFAMTNYFTFFALNLLKPSLSYFSFRDSYPFCILNFRISVASSLILPDWLFASFYRFFCSRIFFLNYFNSLSKLSILFMYLFLSWGFIFLDSSFILMSWLFYFYNIAILLWYSSFISSMSWYSKFIWDFEIYYKWFCFCMSIYVIDCNCSSVYKLYLFNIDSRYFNYGANNYKV